ncbi:hypothetical protein E2C01_078261 [Portunus trituberculatus]|uniref:Uncharacterized protein n=1 Tax=Portunus trituberculatus TaxID=210409 RepID=A0A5B7IND2_PORTR|nr:hypothetical protein [Portunus trituberculatus]
MVHTPSLRNADRIPLTLRRRHLPLPPPPPLPPPLPPPQPATLLLRICRASHLLRNLHRAPTSHHKFEHPVWWVIPVVVVVWAGDGVLAVRWAGRHVSP